MQIKELSSYKIRLLIRNYDLWCFNGVIKFSDHAYNYSSLTINNLIKRRTLETNSHFLNSAFNNGIKGFTVAHLINENKTIFSGIISDVGRRDLMPNQLKDCSIVIEDLRSWLSKKAPLDIQFRNIPPINALNNIVEALNNNGTEKFKVGSVSFTNETNIKAYDTTNKSPYSILKEVIARQTNSFLYFTTDNFGSILINFKSENDFLTQKPIDINEDTISKYKITKININTEISKYINIIRVESDNIISNVLTTETFNLNNNLKSIWLNGKIGNILFDDKYTYIYDTFNPERKTKLLLLNKKDATSGKNYHAYYEKFKNEIVLNDLTFEKENKSMAIGYYKVGKQSVTLENFKEKQIVSIQSGFEGDVYRYTKNNDYSNLEDLIRYGRHELQINSKLYNEITIDANSPFLNVGDIVNIDYGIDGVDDRYICMGYQGEINTSVNLFKIKYTLRNTLNADTILNYYDNQSYRDSPLFDNENLQEKDFALQRNKIYQKYWKEFEKIKTLQELITKKDYDIVGKLDDILDYYYGDDISVDKILEFLKVDNKLVNIFQYE